MKKIVLDAPQLADDQIDMVNKIYLSIDFNDRSSVEANVHKKINGYKQQDRKKNRFNKDFFITYDEIIEKLIISNLLCFYCKKKTLIDYKTRRDPRQWTLDRIDNKIGHNNNNVVISCLKCNLEKRARSHEKFEFTKQMKIIKKK